MRLRNVLLAVLAMAFLTPGAVHAMRSLPVAQSLGPASTASAFAFPERPILRRPRLRLFPSRFRGDTQLTGTLSLYAPPSGSSGDVQGYENRILVWTPDDPGAYLPAEYTLTIMLSLADPAGHPIHAPPSGMSYSHHGQSDIVWSKPSQTPILTASEVGNDRYLHGRPYIQALGLYDYRARFYDPETSTFLETDPLGPVDSPNLYQAFGFDGLNVRDPWGLAEVPEPRQCSLVEIGCDPNTATMLPNQTAGGEGQSFHLNLTRAEDQIDPWIAEAVKRGDRIPTMGPGPPRRGLAGDLAHATLSTGEEFVRQPANILITFNNVVQDQLQGRPPTQAPLIPKQIQLDNERQETIATAEGMYAAEFGFARSLPGGGMLGAEELTVPSGTVLRDPSSIRFSQDSIRAGFKNPEFGTIDDLAQGLRSGRIKANDIEPIRLVEGGGHLITIDNRRLQAFREANVEIPTRMATPEEIAQAVRQNKFSAGPLGSDTIRIRGRR